MDFEQDLGVNPLAQDQDRSILNWASAKLRQRRGNITLMTALVALPLSLVIVGAVELTSLSNEHAVMQAAVDAAALAGAQSRTIAGTNQKSAAEFAQKFALNQVGDFAKRAKVHFVAQDSHDGSFTVQGYAIRPSFFWQHGPAWWLQNRRAGCR